MPCPSVVHEPPGDSQSLESGAEQAYHAGGGDGVRASPPRKIQPCERADSRRGQRLDIPRQDPCCVGSKGQAW